MHKRSGRRYAFVVRRRNTQSRCHVPEALLVSHNVTYLRQQHACGHIFGMWSVTESDSHFLDASQTC
jgi:hypothetical protein